MSPRDLFSSYHVTAENSFQVALSQVDTFLTLSAEVRCNLRHRPKSLLLNCGLIFGATWLNMSAAQRVRRIQKAEWSECEV